MVPVARGLHDVVPRTPPGALRPRGLGSPCTSRSADTSVQLPAVFLPPGAAPRPGQRPLSGADGWGWGWLGGRCGPVTCEWALGPLLHPLTLF